MAKARDLISRSGAGGFGPAFAKPAAPVQKESVEPKNAAKPAPSAPSGAQAQGGGGKAPVGRRPKV